LAALASFCGIQGGIDLIPVVVQQEPATFASSVRAPGARYLNANPSPTSQQFRKHAYWKSCLSELRVVYNGVCAYSSIWVGIQASVDHFVPKSVRPDLAYEWSNYRLALDKINSYKADSIDVLDPFIVQPGWFVLDFATFYVVPGDGLAVVDEAAVERTIDVLRLNRDDALVQLRYSVVKEYADGDTTLNHLWRRYPFIASELIRQDRVDSIKGTM
jgi:hypothetical protein